MKIYGHYNAPILTEKNCGELLVEPEQAKSLLEILNDYQQGMQIELERGYYDEDDESDDYDMPQYPDDKLDLVSVKANMRNHREADESTGERENDTHVIAENEQAEATEADQAT